MEDKSLNFDSITYFVEQYVEANAQEIQKMRSDLVAEIYSPLLKYVGEKVSIKNGQSLLMQCARIAEERLKIICSEKSIDFWLAYIRRFPNRTYFFYSDHWKPYATLAIIKWSNWVEDTTLGQLKIDDNTFGVKFFYTMDDLDNCLKIAITSDLLANIVYLYRKLGKGAKLIVAKGKITTKGSKDVEKAMIKYDLRKPKNYILEEEGIPTEIPPSRDLNLSIILSTYLHERVPIYFPKNNITLFMMNHFFLFVDPKPLFSNLSMYEEAIKTEFGADVRCIAQTLYSLSRQIQTTIPLSLLTIKNNKLVCEYDINNDEILHRVSFMFQFCQRGLLRFPEKHLRKRLSEYIYSPMVRTQKESQALVDKFFDSFLLTKEKREKINLLRLVHFPVVYTSPGENTYFDLSMLGLFLRDIISVSKYWLSTQHGDHFTLAVKNLIVKNASGAIVLAGKKVIQTSKGKKAEIDLLVKKGSTIYVIECKARTKSRDYWLGSIDKIRVRTGEITKAVKQVQQTVGVLKKCIKEKRIELPKFSRIQWIICTPSQEYICPFDKYGLLTPEIPRVCTHEELLAFLKEERGQAGQAKNK